MKKAVVYYSRTGGTQKVAETIAQAAGCDAYDAAHCPADLGADLLFVGGAVYGGVIDPALTSFIEGLDPKKVGRVAVFSTYAFPGPESERKARAQIISALKARGIPAAEQWFSCRGRFFFLGRKRPDAAALLEAKTYAARIAAEA